MPKIVLSFKNNEEELHLYNAIMEESNWSVYIKDVLKGKQQPIDVSHLSKKTAKITIQTKKESQEVKSIQQEEEWPKKPSSEEAVTVEDIVDTKQVKERDSETKHQSLKGRFKREDRVSTEKDNSNVEDDTDDLYSLNTTVLRGGN